MHLNDKNSRQKSWIMLFHNKVGAPTWKKVWNETRNSESGKQVAYDLNMVTQAKQIIWNFSWSEFSLGCLFWLIFAEQSDFDGNKISHQACFLTINHGL